MNLGRNLLEPKTPDSGKKRKKEKKQWAGEPTGTSSEKEPLKPQSPVIGWKQTLAFTDTNY